MRAFLPAAQTCSVNVLDCNGNLVVRVGGYRDANSAKDVAFALWLLRRCDQRGD